MKLRTFCRQFVFRRSIFETVMLLDTEIACRLSPGQPSGAIRLIMDSRHSKSGELRN